MSPSRSARTASTTRASSLANCVEPHRRGSGWPRRRIGASSSCSRSTASGPEVNAARSDGAGGSCAFQMSQQRRTARARLLYESRASPVFLRGHAARRNHEAPVIGHARRRSTCTGGTNVHADGVVRLAADDGDVIFAAAVRADAGVALERAERHAVLDAGEVAGRVARRSRCSPAIRGALRVRASRTSAAAIATISALELLMPDAGGRSLPKAMSAPSAAPGKFFASRRTTVSA